MKGRRARFDYFLLLTITVGLLIPSRQVGAQADVVGQWSALQNWPIVAVHAALMPNGKVFFYPYGDDPRIWDPASNAITTATKVGYNIFCSGQSLTADGKIMLTGGHVENGYGLNDASVYDPNTNSWTRLPDMNNGRWYPTMVLLANGEHLTFTGSYDVNYSNNTLPQVWPVGGANWRNLTGAQLALDLYPSAHLVPDGRVLITSPSRTTRFLNPTGTGQWTTGPQRVGPYRGYGTSVLYDTGKILVLGGADPPVPSSEVIDLNAATPAWRAVGSMSIARRQLNATIMADGKVLATGGSSAPGFNEPAGAVLYAESWDPATEQWTPMAAYQRYRGYHSTALLLPDGRVISAGGDGQPNAEVYSPPYLFKGARPTIASMPAALSWGQGFFLATPDAAAISRVHLIRLGAVTHATNMDQRINRLNFLPTSDGLLVNTPNSPNITPPGYYMLFILNTSGVPSVARIVRVGAAETGIPAAPSNLTAAPVSQHRIDLAWTSNSTNETGYKIEKSKNGTHWYQIGTTRAGVTTYADTDLKRNTQFHYRVRAYNASGDSLYSNTVTARTLM